MTTSCHIPIVYLCIIPFYLWYVKGVLEESGFYRFGDEHEPDDSLLAEVIKRAIEVHDNSRFKKTILVLSQEEFGFRVVCELFGITIHLHGIPVVEVGFFKLMRSKWFHDCLSVVVVCESVL
jgi:hypothetical protein